MSGVEAVSAVIGITTSVIALIDKSKELFDAAKDARGLPAAFREVSDYIPLVEHILQQCMKEHQKSKQEILDTNDLDHKRVLEQSSEAVLPIMLACQENARQLQVIFAKVLPGDPGSLFERYSKAAQAVAPGRKRKVEELMEAILKKLQLLLTNHAFKPIIEPLSRELQSSVDNLAAMPPSLPDETISPNHYGSGSINVNTGTGAQHINNISGGTNNKQFIGMNQYFRDD